MTHYLNRAILRLHGGSRAFQYFSQEAWQSTQRFLMAKKLGYACGCIGYKFFDPQRNLSFWSNLFRRIAYFKNNAFILRLAEKLKLLEELELIKIYDEKIYFVRREVDLGPKGKGVLDIFASIKKAISVSQEEVWGKPRVVDLSHIAERRKELFSEVKELNQVPSALDWKGKLWTLICNPILRASAIDLAAKNRLIEINRKEAEIALKESTLLYPPTSLKIKLIERAMAEAQIKTPDEIIAYFNSLPDGLEPPPQPFVLKSKEEPAFVFVISDVHLETETHPKTEGLLKVLWLARKFNAPLVINGDFYDFFIWHSTFHRIIKNNPQIIEALKKFPSVLEIFGNHDLSIIKKDWPGHKIFPNIYLPEEGTFYQDGVYIEHGHQSDTRNRQGTIQSYYYIKIFTFLSRWPVIRFFFPDTDFMNWVFVGERFFYNLHTTLNKTWARLTNWARKTKIEGKNEWLAYKKDLLMQRIRRIFEQASKVGRSFTEDKPLLYIRGHEHGGGYDFVIQDIVRSVYNDPLLEKRVRYYTTGSWQYDDAYFLVLDYSFADRVYAYPFVWRPAEDQFMVFEPR